MNQQTTNFEARDENFRKKVERSFALQNAMKTIGCTITSMEPGKIGLEFPFQEKFT